jgi:hypothetical protein
VLGKITDLVDKLRLQKNKIRDDEFGKVEAEVKSYFLPVSVSYSASSIE